MNLVKEIERANIRPLELLKYLDSPRELNYAEHADRAVISEAEFVAKRLDLQARDLFKKLNIAPEIGGGSFITGTSSELLYASITTGTQLNTFTTEASLMGTLPYIILPAGFFYNLSAAGKSLRVKAIGRLGTTATPTFTFTARLLTSTTWSAAGVAMSSAAITCGSGVTLAPWFMDLDITARALVAGATGLTLAIMGEVRSGTGFAAGGGVYSIPAANTAFTVTVDHSVTQYLFLSAACGTSNASNLIQLELIKVYGEN